jgi:sugar-phosphatase
MLEIACAAILFDMDGVLVDSHAVVKRTWARWCARNGMDEAAVLRAAHGRRTMDTLRAVAPHVDLEAEARWLAEVELGDSDGIVAVPGAGELTRALPDGGWAVVTSAGRELARRRMEWAGLPAPRSLVSAEQVQHGKPSPEGYLCAAGALGVEASRCVVIEDSPAGVRAARAAGTSVIALTTTHEADELPPVEVLLPDLLRIAVPSHDEHLVLRIDIGG